MTDEARLNDIKQRIDTLKTDKIRAQERLDNALAQLEQQYGYQTVDEAKDAYKSIQKQIPLLETKLNKLLEQIEAQLSDIEQGILN